MVFIRIPEDTLQLLVASFDLMIGPTCNPKQKVLCFCVGRQLRIVRDTLKVESETIWLGVKISQTFLDDTYGSFVDFNRDGA